VLQALKLAHIDPKNVPVSILSSLKSVAEMDDVAAVVVL
jgi:hypothetical protein